MISKQFSFFQSHEYFLDGNEISGPKLGLSLSKNLDHKTQNIEIDATFNSNSCKKLKCEYQWFNESSHLNKKEKILFMLKIKMAEAAILIFVDK